MESNSFQIKSYDHNAISWNLSGTRDVDETTIERVTAGDSEIDRFDLFDLFQPAELTRAYNCRYATFGQQVDTVRGILLAERLLHEAVSPICSVAALVPGTAFTSFNVSVRTLCDQRIEYATISIDSIAAHGEAINLFGPCAVTVVAHARMSP